MANKIILTSFFLICVSLVQGQIDTLNKKITQYQFDSLVFTFLSKVECNKKIDTLDLYNVALCVNSIMYSKQESKYMYKKLFKVFGNKVYPNLGLSWSGYSKNFDYWLYDAMYSERWRERDRFTIIDD